MQRLFFACSIYLLVIIEYYIAPTLALFRID